MRHVDLPGGELVPLLGRHDGGLVSSVEQEWQRPRQPLIGNDEDPAGVDSDDPMEL